MKVEPLGVKRILSNSSSALGVTSDVQELMLSLLENSSSMDFWGFVDNLG